MLKHYSSASWKGRRSTRRRSLLRLPRHLLPRCVVPLQDARYVERCSGILIEMHKRPSPRTKRSIVSFWKTTLSNVYNLICFKFLFWIRLGCVMQTVFEISLKDILKEIIRDTLSGRGSKTQNPSVNERPIHPSLKAQFLRVLHARTVSVVPVA